MKKGWEKKTLGDVCIIDKAQGVHRKLPYVGLEQIESHTARFLGSTQPQAVKSSTFRFSENHVLYGRLRPYLNKALAPDFEGHCSTEIFPFKPNAGLSREFLLYWFLMESTMERINGTCTGARMPRANMNEVLGFDFLLPPLAEQQRIVGLLDEAFEGIATAKANAEKNLQNARALFESHLQSVFSQRGEGWVEKKLEDVCNEIFAGGDVPKDNHSKAPTQEHQIPIYTNGEKNCGLYGYTDKARVTSPSITISARGTIGYTVIREESFYPAIRLIVAIPNPDCLDLGFLFHVVSNMDVSHSGTSIPQLTVPMVREFLIPLPPLSEQKLIVSQFDALSTETQRLASLYTRKLAALEALKKSLLHQAFSGEL